MKKKTFTAGIVLGAILFFNITTASAQINDPVKAFKGYINDMVVNVEHAKEPAAKRAIMNNTLDELLSTFKQVEELRDLSGKDGKALQLLTKNITEKKNELNGLVGFKKVPNSKLNAFANFVQQDMEQAETITISIVVALLIVIILLLL